MDESKNEQFLAVTQAHAAYRTGQRRLDEALGISGSHAKRSKQGKEIEVSGATKASPPQTTTVVLSPGDDHYELASSCAKAFEMFERASGR